MNFRFRKDPARRSLKLEEWPPVDRAAWNRARAPGDVLEPGSGGLASHWRSKSAESFEQSYGRFLGFLDRGGLLYESTAPAARLSPALLSRHLDELRTLNNAPVTLLVQVRHLHLGLKTMFPEQNWDWMRRVIRNLSYLAEPTRDKRARVVPIQELFDYGLELMAKAEAPSAGTAFNRALLYRDGLMIAMLAARPFRESNFASIIIGTHLVKRGVTY